MEFDDSLSADIEFLTGELADGKYYHGFGWDDEIRDERSFGDESWVPAMDSLFARANAVFLGGNMQQAREAYAALFQAFHLDEEVGTFCGQVPAVEMIRTDLREAGARYLRAICHTSEDDDMSADLRDAWAHDLPYRNRPDSVDEVRQALAEDLPSLERFWPRWVDELRRGWTVWAHKAREPGENRVGGGVSTGMGWIGAVGPLRQHGSRVGCGRATTTRPPRSRSAMRRRWREPAATERRTWSRCGMPTRGTGRSKSSFARLWLARRR